MTYRQTDSHRQTDVYFQLIYIIDRRVTAKNKDNTNKGTHKCMQTFYQHFIYYSIPLFTNHLSFGAAGILS